MSLFTSRQDGFRSTLRAFAITLVHAARWPVVLWFFAWQLAASASQTDLVACLASGFHAAAVGLFAVLFVAALCVRDGLAAEHFRIDRDALRALRRHMSILILVWAPAMFLYGLMRRHPDKRAVNSLGRLAFIVGQGALGLFLILVLRPSGKAADAIMTRERSGWLHGFRHVVFAVLSAVPLAACSSRPPAISTRRSRSRCACTPRSCSCSRRWPMRPSCAG